MIDLGAEYTLTSVHLYDDQDFGNTAPIRISYGTPFNWTEFIVDSLKGTSTWNEHIPNQITTRYLRVTLDSNTTKMSEIVLYGSAQSALNVDNPTPVVPTLPTMESFIGINAFVDDPIGRLESIGFLREYHDWQWCEGNTSTSYPGYPNNENTFNPSAASFKFDDFYRNMAQLNITTVPAIQKNVLWMVNNDYGKLNNKPISNGDDSEVPSSYIEHADHLFQYAARYGKSAVSSGNLKLASNQAIYSGLGYLDYFESWNEPDKWWLYRADYFTPYEYAAMVSADYDGHLDSLGITKGIKNADTTAKMVMGGLAQINVDYIKAIKLWADHHRNGEVPFDVINVHHYSNDGGGQFGGGSAGISPEDDQLKEKMKALVDYRNQYMPDKEVWISEFGYDINPSSPQKAPAIDTTPAEEVQGQWIIRSYLELAAAGVDRAALFMLRDVDINSNIQYNSSGLTQSKDSLWAPRPSWYYVYTLKNRLMGMRFTKEVASGRPDVNIYKFKHPTRNESVYALWCTTSNNTTVPNYSFSLEAGETVATSITLTEGFIEGVESALSINNQSVTVNISEKPIFIKVSDGTSYPPLYTIDEKVTLTPSMITNESGIGNATQLVDEQVVVKDPKYNNGAAPATNWHAGWNGNDYPASAYIDLGNNRKLTKVYLYDVHDASDLVISIGSPGNWTPIITDNLTSFNKWNAHVINTTTQYIRITKTTPNSQIGEIVLYAEPE